MTTDRERLWASRALLWLLGGWFLLTLFVAYMAGANFRVLDPQALRNADEVYGAIPAEDRRGSLRYAASELNRHHFLVYNATQTILAGAALLLFVLARRPWRTALVLHLFCLALCAVFLFYFTPELAGRGRRIDFMRREPMPPEVRDFYRLHGLNVALEMAKLGAIALLSVLAARELRPDAHDTTTRL